MKKLLLLVTLGWCCAYFTSFGQNTGPCNAAYTYQVDGNTVKFFATPSPSNHFLFHYWQFGDGIASSDVNPIHTYGAPGTYRVLHMVNDTLENCWDSTSKLITIGNPDCNIEPKFDSRRDSTNCKKIWFINQSVPISANVHFLWNFGDGSSSYDINPSHEYAQPGNYNVCLVMEAGTNCRKEVCKMVELRCDTCPLQIDFNFEKDATQPNKVYFKSHIITPVTTVPIYKWSFGDGSYSQEPNPVHVYNAPGSYNVCLRVAISNTCVRELCKTIKVEDSCRLQAKFEYKVDTIQGNKVYFHNLTISNTQLIHYLWKFGDGTTSTDINAVHVYNQPGVYEVCLVAETNNGCRSEYCAKVEIRPILCNFEPKFEWKAGADNPLRIYFHNLTILPVSTAHFLWKFGDGTTSNEVNPVHVYEKPGEYEVCLIVEVSNLCRKVTCQKIVVSGPECNVHAKFEWKRDPQNWKKIWFANLSQPVPNIWRTYWYYGDGTTSQDFNSFHEYANVGKYTVCLKVVSLNGCIDAFCDTVVVRKPDTCENRSNFKWERASNNALEFKFTPENINLTWKYIWKFGDGTGSTAVTPIHKFPHSGVFTVCLTLIQNNHCETTTCKELKIGAECDTVNVKFEYKRDQERPNKISFQAIGSQPVIKQKWTIKRDSTINGFPYIVVLLETNPTYIFPFSGWYSVCLEATIANGCTKQYCERIFIDRVVNAAVTLTPDPVYPNPASTTVHLELKLDKSVPVRLSVLDETGSQKLLFYVSGQAGNNIITIPVSKLSQGQYLVQLVFANQVRLARFQRM